MATLNIVVKVFCGKCASPLTTEVIGDSIFVNTCSKCEEIAKETTQRVAFNEGWEFGRANP